MTRTCPGCQRPFEGTALHCSPACKLSAWKRRQSVAPSPHQPWRIVSLDGVVTRGTPAAHTGADSAAVLHSALRDLGKARSVEASRSPAGMLHLLTSLSGEIELALPGVLVSARAAGYSFEEIRAISGISGQRARRLVSLALSPEAPLD